jgi:hypothetical protein
MFKRDKVFIILLAVSSVMMAGIMGQNILSSQMSRALGRPIDVARVKADIAAAGLTPLEAKYWKTINVK